MVGPLCLLALRRGWWAPVVGASVGLYVAGQADPGLVDVADLASAPGTWAWATWQVLFVGGLVTGWHWRRDVRPYLERHRRGVVTASVLTTALLAVAANAFDLLAGGAGRFAPLVEDLFEKYALRPGVVAYLAVAVVTLYAVLGRARDGRRAAGYAPGSPPSAAAAWTATCC